MRNFIAPLLKVVVFAAVTVTLTALLGLTIANTNLGPTSGYAARFTDATGLNVGDDIRMSGVRIGQVTDISVYDNKYADVRFDVEAARRLPRSLTATIKYRNLIGQRYVSLGLGTGGDPNAILRPGDVIPPARTRPALNLTVLFNGFRPLFEALDPKEVNQLAGELIQVLQGEGGTIDSVLAHTASLSGAIAGKDKVIGQVIDNLNTVLGTVNDRTTEVSGLIDQLQLLATGLAAQRKPIGDAIGALGELTDSTAGLLGEARPALKGDIAALGRLSSTLADNGDTVEKFLSGLPHKIRAISRVASYGGWFNYYLCSASGRIGVSDLGITVDIPALPLAGTPMADRVRTVKPLRERDQAGVGTVTIVLIVLALLVAFNADNLPIIGGGTTYTAQFTESAGLRPGNEVRLAGVKVGDVRGVELRRDRVVVDFRIDDVSLGDRSTVSIEIKTLLGDKYLALTSAGSAPQRPNDVIPVARTRTPFDIVPAVGQLTDTVDEIDTTQLAKSFAVISDTFANSPKHLRATLTGLTRLSQTLSTRDDQLKTLLSNTAAVSKTVADRDAQLRILFTDASLLLDELSARREAVSTLLSGTTSLADELSGLVADNQRQLEPALDDLDRVTTILQRNQDNLAASLQAFAPYVRMFNNVIGSGRWFDGYICGLVPPPTKVGVLDINPEGCSTPLAYQGGGR